MSIIKNIVPNRWEPVIGLEIHAQLNTRTKAFCRCLNTYGAEPNKHVCPVCLGYPGALPIINREMILMALSLGIAVGGKIHESTGFDRKNYFYPDLPKGYQITQFNTPLITGGSVPIDITGEVVIPLAEIHLEEDAGKNIHKDDYSIVDYNRCGIPLVEIVTQPALKSPIDTGNFLKQLRRLLRSLDICDGNMEKGSLRCDANISLKEKSSQKTGTKVEIKNLNSLKNVKKALEFEIDRQTNMLRNGTRITQETRAWDEIKNETYPIRSKEESSDYRYFPEPDLPRIKFEKSLITDIEKNLPELPLNQGRRFIENYKLSLDLADFLLEKPELCDFFEKVLSESEFTVSPSVVVNWIKSDFVRILEEQNQTILDTPITPGHFAELIRIVSENRINRSSGKEVLLEMIKSCKSPGTLIKEANLGIISDSSMLLKIAKEVIGDNPDEVTRYQSGKTQLLGFFMEKAMVKSEGKADPKEMRTILENLLRSKDS